MGENTGIAWCHHTFNTWWGCVEVSPGCDSCYARRDAARYGFKVWGKDAPRRFFGDKHWAEPLRWDRKARDDGARRRVFCASMADVFEERDDLDQWRGRLWELILATPYLDWLLLTKRPQAMRRMLPPAIAERPNVWPGMTVESQEHAWRVTDLLKIECAGPRWVSYEPALGPVDFLGDGTVHGNNYKARGRVLKLGTRGEPWYSTDDDYESWSGFDVYFRPDDPTLGADRVRWLVVGGESGSKHREMKIEWVSAAVAQCRAAGIPVFVKQDARSRPGQQGRIPGHLWIKEFPACRA